MAKPSGQKQPKTGNDFIELAKNRGALVEDAGTKRGTKFTHIQTPAGSMYITPGTQPLDPRTRKNYMHWLRLLGLLVVLIFTSKFWWPIVIGILHSL